MTIFASTPVHNTDPAPYRFDGVRADQSALDRAWLGRTGGAVFEPRPQFDQPRAHEGNPVLIAVRNLLVTTVEGKSEFYARAAAHLTGGDYAMGVRITPEHSAHARRVLERLAVFA